MASLEGELALQTQPSAVVANPVADVDLVRIGQPEWQRSDAVAGTQGSDCQ
ncbi:hypothetical protein [Paracoccus mutanolyticus]|uniref:hypothetical protein n=1 Tax=Paracoccus mutanolyticus TaxID=1499308 RepID=UPI001672511B|nr:hypothetical protein [Paracoccus mutanolyticus]